MALCKATVTFSTVVMWDGRNELIDWTEGDERDIEDHILVLVERDSPGALKVVKPKAKKSEPQVETKAGASDKAKTRQVTKATKPKGKK